MINLIKSITDNVLKWVLILTGISFILSIASIVLTFDLTDQTVPFLRIFITAMSDFGFLLGSIMMGIGLVKAFFKRPSSSRNRKSENQRYTPKYRNQDSSLEKQEIRKILSSSDSTFSEQELTYIFSGFLTVGIAILIYILFLIISSY